MKFKRGQEVICIDDNWHLCNGQIEGLSVPNPKKGHIYIVDSYDHSGSYITLTDPRYEHYYQDKAFSPLMSDAELEELLMSIPQLV